MFLLSIPFCVLDEFYYVSQHFTTTRSLHGDEAVLKDTLLAIILQDELCCSVRRSHLEMIPCSNIRFILKQGQNLAVLDSHVSIGVCYVAATASIHLSDDSIAPFFHQRPMNNNSTPNFLPASVLTHQMCRWIAVRLVHRTSVASKINARRYHAANGMNGMNCFAIRALDIHRCLRGKHTFDEHGIGDPCR